VSDSGQQNTTEYAVLNSIVSELQEISSLNSNNCYISAEAVFMGDTYPGDLYVQVVPEVGNDQYAGVGRGYKIAQVRIQDRVETVTRRIVISDVSGSDEQICDNANTALVAAAAEYADQAALPSNRTLRLLKKTFRVVAINSRGAIVEADLEYAHIRNLENLTVFSGGIRMQSVNTAQDSAGDQILLDHLFPDSDPDFPSETKQQAAEIGVLVPMETIVIKGRVEVRFPPLYARLIKGALNTDVWAGMPAQTWMVTDIVYEEDLTNASGVPTHWRYTLEFSNNPHGWQPRVYFIDARSGTPVASPVIGVGTKLVEWYPLVNYNELFPLGF